MRSARLQTVRVSLVTTGCRSQGGMGGRSFNRRSSIGNQMSVAGAGGKY